MQERRRGEELIELAETGAGAGHDVGARDVFHAGQEVGNGLLGRMGCGAVDDFVGVLDAEADDVAILQLAAFHFLAVDEKAAALAAIFNVVLVGLDDDCRAGARNSAVRELQMVAGFRAAPDQEGRLRHARKAACAVRRNYFQYSLRNDGYGIRHRGLLIREL